MRVSRYFVVKTLLISMFLLAGLLVLGFAPSFVNRQSAKKMVNTFGRYIEDANLDEAINLFSTNALFESGNSKVDFEEAITQYKLFQKENQLEGSLYTHEIESIGYKNAVVIAVAWLYTNNDSGEATITFKLIKKGIFSPWKISNIKSDDSMFYAVFCDKG